MLDSTEESTVISVNAAVLDKISAFTLSKYDICRKVGTPCSKPWPNAEILDALIALSTNGDSFFLYESSPDNAEVA